ncbi:MAG: hypothetical protein SF182_12480 [Deltaproteobacteria bacterium]|nr:hypothetical protein [Deltaproteobacteria bacterium]
MRIIAPALLTLWVATAATAQPCENCPGDLNGDGVVSIDEVVTVVNSALGVCADANLLFGEEFSGASLDAQRWSSAANGFPESATRVSDGALAIGTREAALDFPFVESNASPFPASGDVRLEIALRYTGIGVNGGGVGVVGENGRSLARIDLRAQGYGGKLTVTFPGGVSTLSEAAPLELHTFAFVFRNDGQVFDAFVDGQLLIGNLAIDSRPARLWFGHPSVGQTFGIDATDSKPPGTNDAGTVTERWWTSGTWSPFVVDSVRVERACD